MSSKKNILLIVYNLAEGGAQRLASNLSLELSKYHNIYIVINENNIDYPYNGKLFILNSKASNNLIRKFFAFIYRIKRIKEIKKQVKADYTISFLEDSNIINLCANCGDKKIISLHSDYPLSHMKGLIKIVYFILYKIFYKKADNIIVVSKYTKKLLIDNLKIKENKIKVIYNLIDIDSINTHKIKPLDFFEEYFKNRKVIINMGRLTYQKGQWHLLRAFKQLKDIYPDIALVLLGEGDLREYLLEMSKSLKFKTYNIWDNMNLNDNYDVYFLGFQKNPFSLMGLSKFFVFSSLWEGFPMALLEAMASGLPVISTDCYSGPREILAPNTDFLYKTKDLEKADYGILIPEGDKKYKKYNDPLIKMEISLIGAMKLLLEDENLYKHYKEQSLKRAKDFDKKEIMNKWLETIELC